MNDLLVYKPSGSVCLVTGGPDAPGGDIGVLRSAQALAQCGWAVHVLCCNYGANKPAFHEVGRQMAASGVGVSLLDDLPLPAACRAPNGTPGCGPGLYASNLIRHGLEILHRSHRFDAVVFPSWQAAGFRSIQAKQAGAAFGDVRLTVRLDGIGQWTRDAAKRWSSPDDLFIDYCERYTFDNADIQISPSIYLLEQARRLGWQVRSDARPTTCSGVGSNECPIELVYLGGMKANASVDLFLDATASLEASVPITFLCPRLCGAELRRVSQRIERRLPNRRLAIHCGLDRVRTCAYLAEGDRLAVICDRLETLDPEIRDCLANGVPFLCARPRWLPGHIGDGPASDPWFFDADADDAAQRLHGGMLAWTESGAADHAANDLVGALWASEAAPPCPSRPGSTGPACHAAAAIAYSPPESSARASPIVTVGVTYYNLGKYLPETLASLAEQTFADLEVLVIDDGSTEEESLQVWDEQRLLYPQFRFIRQPNAGLGAARNRALREAKGEFFIPVDADNIAAPDMAASFVRGMRRCSGASALSCFFLAFEDTADIRKGKFLHQYCPTAGPHLAACMFNIYGDANAVFRTADLRAAGGFETDRSTYCHDWETFVKLARTGRRIGVVPDYLIYYRRRPDGMSAVMTRGGADLYPFVQRMLTTCFIGKEAAADADARMLWTALAGFFRQNEPGGWAAPRAKSSLVPRLIRGAAKRAAAAWRLLGNWTNESWLRARRISSRAQPDELRHAQSGLADRSLL